MTSVYITAVLAKREDFLVKIKTEALSRNEIEPIVDHMASL